MKQKRRCIHPAVLKARSVFSARGSSLHEFCVENGIDWTNVHKYLQGTVNSDTAKAARNTIFKEIGYEQDSAN